MTDVGAGTGAASIVRGRLRAQTRGGGLAARLRAETAGDHLAAEAAFDLPRRLASLDAYAGGLLVMAGFHDAWAPALDSLGDRLPAELRAGPRMRRARLRADLEALGHLPPPPLPFAAVPADPDRALGAWYVHEGAALGGLVIAAEVRRRLPGAHQATSFFAGEGRGTAARWRVFQDTLAGWERRGEVAATRVLAGAEETFRSLTGLLALEDAA